MPEKRITSKTKFDTSLWPQKPLDKEEAIELLKKAIQRLEDNSNEVTTICYLTFIETERF